MFYLHFIYGFLLDCLFGQRKEYSQSYVSYISEDIFVFDFLVLNLCLVRY